MLCFISVSSPACGGESFLPLILKLTRYLRLLKTGAKFQSAPGRLKGRASFIIPPARARSPLPREKGRAAQLFSESAA
jgi:hypothetical protein